MKIFKLLGLMLIIVVIAACSSSNNSGSDGDTDDEPSGDEVDRSSLPSVAPAFTHSPVNFPSGLDSNLRAFGAYNINSDCEGVHIGWDFMPNVNSYDAQRVPIVAVADGIVTRRNLGANDWGDGQVNTYGIILGVSRDVDVHYNLEPFATFGDADADEWIEVNAGDQVVAGQTLGYLIIIEGNAGENLIHLDLKVGVGEYGSQDYVCPTDYFSTEWITQYENALIDKNQDPCPALCQ